MREVHTYIGLPQETKISNEQSNPTPKRTIERANKTQSKQKKENRVKINEIEI